LPKPRLRTSTATAFRERPSARPFARSSSSKDSGSRNVAFSTMPSYWHLVSAQGSTDASLKTEDGRDTDKPRTQARARHASALPPRPCALPCPGRAWQASPLRVRPIGRGIVVPASGRRRRLRPRRPR
jgi:hypothetical protein